MISSSVAQVLRLVLGPQVWQSGFRQSDLSRPAVATFFLRAGNAGYSFVLGGVLAYALGADGYGIYAFAMTSVSILAAVALLGMDALIMRETAMFRERSQWSLMAGICRRADQAGLASSCLLAALGAIAAWGLSGWLEPGMQTAVLTALPLLPWLTLMRVRQAAMIGNGREVMGQLPESLVQPVSVAVILAIVLVAVSRNPRVEVVIGIHVVAAALAWTATALLSRRALPVEITKVSPNYDMKKWARDAVTFWLTVSFGLIGGGSGVIFMGLLKGADDTGVYAMALLLSGAVGLPLLAVSVPLAPAVARAHAAGRMAEIQELVVRAARSAAVFAVPVGLFLILFGSEVLSLFGPEFSAGGPVLVVLCVAQLINTALGYVALTLQMTGHERTVALWTGIAAALNITLGAILIPAWGAIGAASASAANIVTWNIALALAVRRRTGIQPTILGRLAP